MPGIKTYCHIKQNMVYLDGKLLFEDSGVETLKAFAVKAFKHFQFKYPRFYKMDDISKLGFLAAELLLKNTDELLLGEDVGIVLSNSQSTLVTDTVFRESINDINNFFPSPSVFVYTLPNIMIGEISIRHKFTGENAFFIFDSFNAEFIVNYIKMLGANQKLTNCLGGWVDQSNENYEAFVYLTTTEKTEKRLLEHSAKEVRKLYELT